jgi:hypothetical protein
MQAEAEMWKNLAAHAPPDVKSAFDLIATDFEHFVAGTQTTTAASDVAKGQAAGKYLYDKCGIGKSSPTG